MGLAAERAERLGGVHRCAEYQAKHAARLVIEGLGVGLTLGEHVEVGTGQVIVVIGIAGAVAEPVGPAAKLQVEPVDDGLGSVMGASPVAYHHPVEAPFTLEDVVEHPLVVAEVLVLVIVVGSHYRPRATLLDSCLESGQVDFIEGAVIDYHVGGVAVDLLVVEGVMFHAGGNAAILHPLDIRHHHPGGQVGVFTHVLEVAAVKRGAIDVHARAEQYILPTVKGLLADRAAIEGRHLGVPGGRQAGQRGESDAGVIGPSGLVPFIPQHLGAYPVGAVGGPETAYSKPGNPGGGEFRLGVEYRHLLGGGHPREGILHPLLDVAGAVEICRNVGRGVESRQGGCCRYEDLFKHQRLRKVTIGGYCHQIGR